MKKLLLAVAALWAASGCTVHTYSHSWEGPPPTQTYYVQQQPQVVYYNQQPCCYERRSRRVVVQHRREYNVNVKVDVRNVKVPRPPLPYVEGRRIVLR